MNDKYRFEVEKKIIGDPISISSENTALIVIDALNDSFRPDGIFAKLGFDLSLMKVIEPRMKDIISFAAKQGIVIIYVTSFYDLEYVPHSMKELLIQMDISPLKIYNKGTWGVDYVDSLPPINDYTLIKSHYSIFAESFSFIFKDRTNNDLESYLKLPATADKQIKSKGQKTLRDYYSEAARLNREGNSVDIQLPRSSKDLQTLDFFLRSKGIEKLILIGASTHVCINAAVNGASERDYSTLLPIDAITSEDPIKHWNYLHSFSIFNSKLAYTKNLIN